MVRQCLIDGDVLLYEIGYASEASWRYSQPNKEKEWYADNPPPWELVREILDNRISHIEMACEATDPSLLFFTGKTNFRHQIAKRVEYKKRASAKPYHYYNLKASLKGRYEWYEQEGFEADDLMAMHQTARREQKDTIICTRDKDLRQVAGWHYGWELGEQPSFGPYHVDGYGHIEMDAKRKLRGWGSKFFLAQCIMGDGVDTIPGLKKGSGPVQALHVVGPTSTYAEGLAAVLEAYREVYEAFAEEELLEQGRLLWMLRHQDDMWSLDYEG